MSGPICTEGRALAMGPGKSLVHTDDETRCTHFPDESSSSATASEPSEGEDAPATEPSQHVIACKANQNLQVIACSEPLYEEERAEWRRKLASYRDPFGDAQTRRALRADVIVEAVEIVPRLLDQLECTEARLTSLEREKGGLEDKLKVSEWARGQLIEQHDQRVRDLEEDAKRMEAVVREIRDVAVTWDVHLALSRVVFIIDAARHQPEDAG